MSDYRIAIKIAGELEKSFNSAIKGAQMGLKGLGKLGKIGAAGMGVAGAAIAAVAAASINVGREFEAAMSSTAATAGATSEEYDRMKAAAMEMGRTTSKTATESAQALEYMALAGWSVDDSIKGLPSVLRLSEATGLDLARASDLVTDSMAACGLSVNQLSGYLDVCAKANNKSNQTAEELMEAYIGVGGVMNNLGVPITESATALGVMASRGIKGSEAGTALNAVMTNLTTGTGQAGAMMQKLGVSAFDSNGKFIGLEATLQSLNTALSGCTEEQRNAALAAIGGKTHVDALNALMAGLNTTTAEGATEWAALEKELSNANGALEQMAKTKLDNLNGDLAALQSALEDCGIRIYNHMQAPLRELSQTGTEYIRRLSNALDKGGFAGLATEIGSVFADTVTLVANNAPAAVDAAASLVESLIKGVEANKGEIGSALANLVTTGITSLAHIIPQILTVGAEVAAEFAKGIINNLPQIEAAAKEAVSYLMNSARSALKGYTNFLGDDTVAPFKKFLALLPAIAGGFAAIGAAISVAKKIKSIISALTGLGKATKPAARGLGNVGSTMSTAAQNILGVGVGFAAAAAGIWLLSNAAIQITSAGPAASVALIAMAAGIAALMTVAGSMGSSLQAGKDGLIAFGAAVLMASAGMSLMAVAAAQMAQAGPLALAGLVVMEAGIASLLAIAGSMGAQLTAASTGLIAFGAAVLMASAGMSLMSFAATQLAAAGGAAIATFAGMAVGLAAFMAIAAALGPALTAGAAGIVALGAGLLLAAAGMAVLTQAAISLAAAGPTAQVAMAALAVGVIAFGAAAGALSPLLMAGAAALAAFGAALVVVGAGLAAMSAAAMLGATALGMMAAVLPQIVSNGTSGAASILALSAAITAFAAGTALAGAGATAAAAGLTALSVAAAAADIAFAPLAVEMSAIGSAVSTMAASAATAASGMAALKESTSGMTTRMATLAVAFAPAAAAVAPFSAAMTTAAASVASFTAAIMAISAAITTTTMAMTMFTMAVTMGMTQAQMAVTTGMAAIAAAITSGMMMTVSIVTSGMAMLVAAVQSGGASAVAAAQSAASGIYSAFASVNLYGAGVSMMSGLVAGIQSMAGAVIAAAQSVASAAAAAVNGALQIHSPSKVMIQSGQFAGKGLALGMENMTGAVQAAAAKSLAQPVQDSAGQMRSLQMPEFTSRSSVIGETIRDYNRGGKAQSDQQPSGGETFVFSPTYRFEGAAPSKDDVVEANRMSQKDFERMMKEYLRKKGRVAFG